MAPDAAILAQAERLLAESRAKRDVLPNLALRVSIDGNPNVRVFADDTPVATSEAIALERIRIEASGGEVLVEGNTHQAQQLADAASEQELELSTLLAAVWRREHSGPAPAEGRAPAAADRLRSAEETTSYPRCAIGPGSGCRA